MRELKWRRLDPQEIEKIEQRVQHEHEQVDRDTDYVDQIRMKFEDVVDAARGSYKYGSALQFDDFLDSYLSRLHRELDEKGAKRASISREGVVLELLLDPKAFVQTYEEYVGSQWDAGALASLIAATITKEYSMIFLATWIEPAWIAITEGEWQQASHKAIDFPIEVKRIPVTVPERIVAEMQAKGLIQ